MTATHPPRFSLFNTQERILRAAELQQDFQIGIWLPFSFFTSERTYPVLYVPDGEFVYGLATGLIPTLIGNGEIPEVLVVGIAYHGITGWAEHGLLRDGDFLTPGFQQPGQASRLPQYTRFYQQALFPLIETEYRGSASDRTLFGFSSGGFFSLYTCFTQPGMFRRHIAASCTWPGADEVLLTAEEAYARQPAHTPTDLYLTAGEQEVEQMSGFQKLTSQVKRRGYPHLRFACEIFAGEGHSSGVLAKTFLNGVRAVYQP